MPRTHVPASEGRGLRIYNAIGVVLLFVVCMAQWHGIHQRDARLQALETARTEVSAAMVAITNTVAQLHVQVSATQSLNETNAQRATRAESKVETLERQILASNSVEQTLREQLALWKKGISERDDRLKTLSDQFSALVAERDVAIRRYNELVRQHNEVVALLEKVRVDPTAKQPSP